MRHPSPRGDGRGHLSATAAPHWLLIGNSRWHWGALDGGQVLQGWSEQPEAGAARLQQLKPDQLVSWAAVGGVSEQAAPLLPVERQLTTAAVPLLHAPSWLGVDRALAAWGAWRRSGGAPVLVADAGTALSLTRVRADGSFAGGRLLAGAGLQLRALGRCTAALPLLDAAQLLEATAGDRWPAPTAEAMAVGVVRGLAAALAAAAAELGGQGVEPLELWLTGGDGPLLAPLLTAQGQPWRLAPHLVLEALAELRPGPDP